MVVNTAVAREHVAEVQRMIRTIKERVRALCSVLPFTCLHKLILTNAVYHAVLWLNAFPAKNGVSGTLSPRAIVARTKLKWSKHCRVPFGTYCKVHDEKDPTNDNIPRTHEAIALGPTGNLQGSYKFFLPLRQGVSSNGGGGLVSRRLTA